MMTRSLPLCEETCFIVGCFGGQMVIRCSTDMKSSIQKLPFRAPLEHMEESSCFHGDLQVTFRYLHDPLLLLNFLI